MADDLPETTGPSTLPTPYVTQYTNKTLAITPLVLTGIRVWAVAMLEWGSLRFIDHAPVSVWIASSIIAAFVLVVLERQDWLNFKSRRYFPVSLASLLVIWAGIVGYAYYFDNVPGPVVSNLQSQLISVAKDRDAARQERDAAVRVLQGRNAPAAPNAPPASASQTSQPPDDPNEYPPLTRARERALVEELSGAKDILGIVPMFAAGAHNEARGYLSNFLLTATDRKNARGPAHLRLIEPNTELRPS
jgi:hypothetical protein